MSHQQPWLVAYDISDDRQRRRMFLLLRRFGQALQKSVFLCYLDATRKTLLDRLLARRPLASTDRLHLCRVLDAKDLALDATEHPHRSFYLVE